MLPAWADVPAINAAESAVRLDASGGFGGFQETLQPRATQIGPLWGVGASVSALSPYGLARDGWPDLYTSVAYDYSASSLQYNAKGQQGDGKTYADMAVVRLGLGRGVASDAELIPYIAGGYQAAYWHASQLTGDNVHLRAGVIGAGLKVDLAPAGLWVISAAAEGFALVGESVSVPYDNEAGDFGAGATERVSLDADYRLNGAWHAFAGLGLTHYGYGAAHFETGGLAAAPGSSLQLNSLIGIAYGF